MIKRNLVLPVVVLAAVTGAVAQMAQKQTPPKARYFMDVSTTSGMMGGDMNPMAMLMGGTPKPRREVLLRLGSVLPPADGAPKADHFMPASMRLGASVPLDTPVRTPVERSTPGERSVPQNFERPKGRLLIFWGCGPKAGAGQPVVIDFAKVAAGQFPPGLFSSNVPVENGPMQNNSRTFGEWPNERNRARTKSDSSLVGEHRIAGNYSPEIKFALDQDFMPGMQAQTQQMSGGAVALNWNQVMGATGYYAWLFGAKNMDSQGADMVWWTSAGRQEFGSGLWDWLSPGTVSRLITQNVVMPPTQTTCTIPAEVKQAAGEFMMASLYAYGPERNFAYPPRPANPKTPWIVEWTAKARFRSSTSVMVGMEEQMGRSGRRGRDDGDNSGNQPARPCRPSLGGLLGGRAC